MVAEGTLNRYTFCYQCKEIDENDRNEIRASYEETVI